LSLSDIITYFNLAFSMQLTGYAQQE